MQTLLQSTVGSKAGGAASLPQSIDAFREFDFRMNRGNIVLFASGPGTGKSLLAMTIALKARVTTLYVSADSDEFTQTTRALSIETGLPLSRSAEMVSSRDTNAMNKLVSLPMQMTFDPAPTIEYLEMQIQAFEEVYGEYPELIIIDNLMNVSFESESTFTDMSSLMGFFHTLARTTGACVLVLHHVTGTYNDANQPIPMSGIKGQVSQLPSQILTLHRKDSEFGPSFVGASIVKNRGGRMDPSGRLVMDLPFDGSRAAIG